MTHREDDGDSQLEEDREEDDEGERKEAPTVKAIEQGEGSWQLSDKHEEDHQVDHKEEPW